MAHADAADDGELAARIAGTMGYVLARLGDVDLGERICIDALNRAGLSAEVTAQLEGQLGMLALERGLLDDALVWLGKSIAGLEAQPVKQANARMNRSLVAMQRGHLQDAVADLELAEAAYRSAGVIQEARLAVHNRGYVRMLAGDVVSALNTMQSVREQLDDESEMWAAINEVDRAEVLREAGLVTEAERSLLSVSRAMERHHAPREQATAEYHLARSLLHHDARQAATVASRAARRFRRIGSTGWAARAEALRLRGQLAVGRLGRSGDVVPVAGRLPSPAVVEAVVAQLKSLGFRAEADALRIDHVLARVRLGQSVHFPRFRVGQQTPLEIALLVHELRARHAAGLGRHLDARRHAAKGLDLLDASFRDGGSLDLQSMSSMRADGLITIGIAQAIRSRDALTLFDWSERARLLNGRIVAVRPPPDPAQAADLAELRVLRMSDPEGDWLTAPRARQLRDRARERQWTATGVSDMRRRVALQDAQAELGDDENLACFLFDGRQLIVLVVTASKTLTFELDLAAVRRALRGLRADLEMSASVRDGPMAKVVQRALRERLRAVSAALVAPWAEFVIGSGTRVAVAAPGILSGVPWTMLPDLHGTALTVVGSVSGWVRGRRSPQRAVRAAAFVAGPRVARAAEEVGLARHAWDRAVMLQAQDATTSKVREAASAVDVLHIAAHGRHAVDNPMFSGLELADGTLFGYDIDLIENVPDTVVLSACEVGRSSVRWGEEAVGMTRVWLHAGARCVVAAPVVVADDDACELLAAMHEGLAAGIPPSVALADASERTGIVAPFQVHGAGF